MTKSTQDERCLAQSRIAFLTKGEFDPRAVRRLILASWQRSSALHVPADKIEIPYDPHPQLDTALARSATPVLQALREHLDGQSVGIVLTDATGLVLRRLTGDGGLERHLDRVLLAPGFSYGESSVGTNGIGTALEVGGPAVVFGHEHYAENLDDLACAGVPIHHPVSGRLVGVIDLTCWRRDAGALLLTLAKTTAVQIRQALLADANVGRSTFFQEFLSAGRGRAGPVIGISHDLVLLNDEMRALLEPADQAVLVDATTDALKSVRSSNLVVELGSGRLAHLTFHPVGDAADPTGLITQVRLGPRAEASIESKATRTRMPLPGLVGSGLPWLHACEEAERAFLASEWLAVEGEGGVGKSAILRALQLRRQPVGRLVVLDAQDAAGRPDWLELVRSNGEADSVVIRHVDCLEPSALRGLTLALQAARADGGALRWAAVTLENAGPTPEMRSLLRLFPTSLEVPPLRLHLEDLHQLVPFLLSRMGAGSTLTCAPQSMRMLMRMSWPGNVEQLYELLRDVVKHRRSGSIEPGDLPPEAHTLSRRVLTPLESLERDAIVRALSDTNGDKVWAAQYLGMSRATIYRKIHDYGILRIAP